MTTSLHSGPTRQGFGALAAAAPPDRDRLGTVLGVIWGLGSLLVMGGLGYLMQHSPPGQMAAGSTVASAPDSSSSL